MRTSKTKPTAEPKSSAMEATEEQLIAAGWGDVPRSKIPADWRTRTAPTPAPAAAQPDPDEYRAHQAALKQRVKVIKDLFGDISEGDLEMMETAKLINAREKSGSTPVESFIWNLLLVYRLRENVGKGMTLEQIEQEITTLREDYSAAIDDAHFIADRYPRPEASNAE